MISCKEVFILCNKSQYKEATFTEKFKLFTHLLICRACIRFSYKNIKLTSLCKRASLYSLSEKEKMEIKQYLKNNT